MTKKGGHLNLAKKPDRKKNRRGGEQTTYHDIRRKQTEIENTDPFYMEELENLR